MQLLCSSHVRSDSTRLSSDVAVDAKSIGIGSIVRCITDRCPVESSRVEYRRSELGLNVYRRNRAPSHPYITTCRQQKPRGRVYWIFAVWSDFVQPFCHKRPPAAAGSPTTSAFHRVNRIISISRGSSPLGDERHGGVASHRIEDSYTELCRTKLGSRPTYL
jgi:hypothetical protein